MEVILITELIEYGIKYVYPDWYMDDLKEKRVGFPQRENRTRFAKGAKLLIYLTTAQQKHMYSPLVKEFQRRIVGIYTVLGGFSEGEHFPNKAPGYPLNLPVTIDYLKNDPREGLPYEAIKRTINWFQPHRGESHQPISEDEYILLRNQLINT